ncbi:hypothetical protein GVN16_12630 [Emticicia sp. CRIBPO]|uniref:hypothetical protein n=1 Tax=Emticicia sp. CRIBPO TaxID=2683258 RepID=UPI0014135059|nr:hypothetical protein [Emticicia sp. CRIBPO]NBA86611.1 hypothetical protein [Emticicia sp. CRIBPO]
MKILQFYISDLLLAQNQISLADTIRMAIYQENEVLFNLLDYENDILFLEPNCFCYFLSDIDPENRMSLEQTLFGYIAEEKRPSKIAVKADLFGLVNLPNLGYIQTNPFEVLWLSSQEIEQRLLSGKFVKNSSIRLCLHPTDHLSCQKGVVFDESVEQSLAKHQKQLEKAIDFFQNQVSDFWQLITGVNNQFVVFSSPNHNSFASISHHGTAYFNVENKQKSPIFFIDDIAHQCGHVIFNVLTLEATKFLKVSKDYPLRGFSTNPQENRGVYGAFHGLFTYTTILHSLDKVLKSETLFDEKQCHEALGRMGFYMHKFYLDLQLMSNSEILTHDGLAYHKQFLDGYNTILLEYGKELALLDYSNQPYTFQYDLFNDLNPLQ